MKVLERHITYGPFLERLRSASARVLLLDYDGTLAPFVVDRALALPYPEVPALIGQIMAQGTRVVIISGRPVRELLLLMGISPQPEIWGSRGLDPVKAEKLAREVSRLWKPLLDRAPVRLLEFDGGLEIRVAGPGKGDAVRVILKEAGLEAAVAYLGDDQTDEDAFRALKGNGLTALVRAQSRPSSADIWLQPPHELLRFL